MAPLRIAGENVNLLAWSLTFAVGAAGGFAAKFIGAPLPMLTGSVFLVGFISVFGFHTRGRPPIFPMWIRLFFMPIIGLSIGAAFTPEIMREAINWWPTLLALCVFIPTVHMLGFIGYSRFGGIEPRTAYYASIPGGLIEAIAMGEEAGGDVRMMGALQFMRLILCVMLVPLAFTILSGGSVGSAAGAVLVRGDDSVTLSHIVELVALGAIGFFGGRLLRLPAYIITGPILVSGIAHLSGWTNVIPPAWSVEMTQLVVGVSLGTRFVGMAPKAFVTALKLAFANILMTMILAVLASLALHRAVGQKTEAVTLAFAPGGVAEMSLVAVSLEISVVYVTAHHVLRIVLSIMQAKFFSRYVLPPVESPR
ncbi:AbrB family transcriptional regulator [Acuticoccus sp. M5D2P5]|uniref:AbrB family transcriptional regulator n=1 Tax=Acuticoccus kalidii TaxID=2910977 RepID=UPI001F356BEA|nr:AbrB family transcriptional regulator [Acuticoccus kalidii]MCF3932450.1 AbrB family transcriptional regulator [Acuticoccus kalidii]